MAQPCLYKKQAILILAHHQLNLVLNMIKHFDNDFVFYIHLDRKGKYSLDDVQRLEQSSKVIYVSSKYKVNWGGRNILKATMLLFKEAIRNDSVDRIHLISGSDIPIQMSREFKTFFHNNPKQYIELEPLPRKAWAGNGGYDRFTKYYLYDYVNVKSQIGQTIESYSLKLQKKFGVKRSISDFKMPLYGGGNWFSITKKCAKYLVQKTTESKTLFHRLKYTFAPEEVYFQTLIMNSPFAKDVENDYLRYIDWHSRGEGIPAILDKEHDLFPIFKSNAFFARKVEFPMSSSLVKTIYGLLAKEIHISKHATSAERLDKIALSIYKNASKCEWDGLYFGKVGIAIFLFHYAKYKEDAKFSELAFQIINQAIGEIPQKSNLKYDEGVFGIGTALEYVCQQKLIDEDSNSLLKDIDDIALKLLHEVEEKYLPVLFDDFGLNRYLYFRAMNNENPNQQTFKDYLTKFKIKDLPQQNRVAYPNALNFGLYNGKAYMGMELLKTLVNDDFGNYRSLF